MPYIKAQQQQNARRRSIHAVLMRSGTSKGLFLHRSHLPKSETEWAPILLSAMGSSTGDKRQLNGVGGATSTTSKVAVVGKSLREDADIEYTFAQVAIGSKNVDMTGNCGNIASGVAPFALDEGLVTAVPGQQEVSQVNLTHTPHCAFYTSQHHVLIKFHSSMLESTIQTPNESSHLLFNLMVMENS